jgi:hypothetical protein
LLPRGLPDRESRRRESRLQADSPFPARASPALQLDQRVANGDPGSAGELVASQVLDLLDELGTAMEPWSDVGVGRALVTPAEDPPFNWAQPRRRRSALRTAGELAHLDHAVNESGTSTETLGDVADGYFLLHEALDSPFDRAEVLDVNHALRPAYVVRVVQFPA